jgi:microcystin-dependent protein
MADPYLGEIRLVPFNFAPVGWLFCNGELLPISDYNDLFQLIGTTYGGNGTTNFALPNMQSRVPIHQGTGGGSTYIPGQEGGVESVTLTTEEIPPHTHALMASSANGTTQAPVGHVPAATARRDLYSSSSGNASLSASSVSVVGGESHENRQPYLVLNFIICVAGVYPTQG